MTCITDLTGHLIRHVQYNRCTRGAKPIVFYGKILSSQVLCELAIQLVNVSSPFVQSSGDLSFRAGGAEPRVCKAVIKATLKNFKYKIYFDLFNTFLVTT